MWTLAPGAQGSAKIGHLSAPGNLEKSSSEQRPQPLDHADHEGHDDEPERAEPDELERDRPAAIHEHTGRRFGAPLLRWRATALYTP